MAVCVMAVVAVAPCQCFSPGGNQTTSPGRIFSIVPPQRCARPQPAVTMRVWPSGWVCHAVRAPGSNVTLEPSARAGAFASNNGSILTVPVKYSAGPLLEACEPTLLISISWPSLLLLLRSRGYDLNSRSTGACTNHWFQIRDALVLRAVSVVDPIIDRPVDRLESHFLRNPCRLDPTRFLPQRSLIPTRVLPVVCTHIQCVLDDDRPNPCRCTVRLPVLTER